MHGSAPTGLAIAAAKNDADLEAMVTVRTAADPDAPPPRIQNLRHNLSAQKDLVYLVARLDGEPVACGFVYPDIPQTYAEAHLVVVPQCAATRSRVGHAGGGRRRRAPVREGVVARRGARGRRRVARIPRAAGLFGRRRRAGGRPRPRGARAFSRRRRPRASGSSPSPSGRTSSTRSIPLERRQRRTSPERPDGRPTSSGARSTSTGRRATRSSSSSRSRATSPSATRCSTTTDATRSTV